MSPVTELPLPPQRGIVPHPRSPFELIKSLSASMNGQEQQGANSPYYNVAQPPPPPQAQAKRKGDEESPSGGQRAKRNRYISIACNECKRRKIKCNGQNPCQRCGNLQLECVYAPNCCSTGFKDSEEFRAMNAQIQGLQEQVNDLYHHLQAMRGGHAPAPYPPPMHSSLGQSESPATYRSAVSPPQSRGSHPQYQGPTSSAYNFDVAKSSLQTMGIAEPEVNDEGGQGEIDPALGAPHQHQVAMAPIVTHPQKDPLWQLNKEEAIRLCKVYDEEMGIMYPMLDMVKTIGQASTLFSFTESAKRTGLMREDLPGADVMGGHDIDIIKMVLASALTVEAYGQSELGNALYGSCRGAIESRLSGPVEIKGLILLVLVAEYNFQQDEEVQASRMIGIAARQCLEIGLHRRQNLMSNFPDDEERSWAIKLFWSIYVLDRRWAFGTGIPFALQDSDIDPALPQPDDSVPYLTAMITYSRVAAKVWPAISNFDKASSTIDKDSLEFLDYSILQWHESIPQALRYRPSDSLAVGTDTVSRGQRRLQVILYLRTNQMRSQLYRPVLHSVTSIMENRHYAQTVIDVAKDTIRVLTTLNETTDIYRTQQVCFNYFLISALAVIFLAVAHAPVEFSRQVRDEFYQALEIVKGFSGRSYVARRLWKTIRGLKEVGPKLGLISRQTKLTDASDPHSSAALAMAGLAGHAVDEMAAYAASAQNPGSLAGSPLNGQQMSYELTSLFEAAGGLARQGTPHTQTLEHSSNGYVAPPVNRGDMSHGQEGFSGMYGNEGEFSKIMGSLF